MNSASQHRTIFFISDGTGITAETLGSSLLTQFDDGDAKQTTLPFINTIDKARDALAVIENAAQADGGQPIVFSTTVNDAVRDILRGGNFLFLDLFDAFLPSLERALGVESSHLEGRAHGIADSAVYESRIDAMNFALGHDDGLNTRDYERAQVILVAPSRCGKTPVSIYMATHFGIYVANYPLTEEDFEARTLPPALIEHRARLHGLWIEPARLHDIRSERRTGSRYASMPQVSYELRQADRLYRANDMAWVETTNKSIEEIATLIMQSKNLRRHGF